jgi:phosphatidate cytidylyltransferase
MILKILSVTTFLFIIGGIVMYAANRRVDAATRHHRWTKFGVYIIIVYAVIGSALAGFFVWLAGLISLIGGYEIFRLYSGRKKSRAQRTHMLLTFSLYLLLSSGFLAFSHSSSPEVIVFVYLTVAVFDGFSQVIGQLIGRHQLAPAISPAKTVEGTLGGLCSAMLFALLLRSLPHFSVSQALLTGGLLSAAGLGGDLLASWCKRLHGVKDFGGLLPGHGGILDRFDSVFAAAIVFWLYTIFPVG